MTNGAGAETLGILLGLTVGYLIGSFSWSILISKFIFKSDIRTKGSGNAGATNILRNHGWTIGFTTFALDAAKPWIVSGILRSFQIHFFQDTQMVPVGIFATIIGHAFPVYYKFKGGKGVSCFLGASLLISPWIALIVWGFTFFVLFSTKIMSITSFVLTIFISTLYLLVYSLNIHELQNSIWFLSETHMFSSGPVENINMIILLWTLTTIVISLHHQNIKRLLNGTEKKISRQK